MLKQFPTILVLLVLTAAIAAPAYPQEHVKIQASMRAPAASPQAAPTLSAEQQAAQAAAEKGTPEQQAFARKVADAMSAKDYDAIKELIAPSTLKCIGKNEDYLQERIRRQFELPISRKFTLKITKLPGDLKFPSKLVTYTMKPTHLMGMDFTAPDGNHDTVNLPIGNEAGNWYEAQPCPTEAGVVRFGKLQHMRAVQREHDKAAMEQVKEPVKSQLLALISKHDSVSAWQVCMSSLHYDFPTCRGIVALMAGDTDY